MNNVEAVMLERTVEMEVAHPIAGVYALWADMENLPRWMRLVREVRVLPGDGTLSRWKFGPGEPLVVEWTSRTTRQIPLRLIAWESVTGLSNHGQIEFFPAGAGCRLKLSLAFDVPGGPVGAFLQTIGVHRWVDENLIADLERFRQLVEAPRA